MGAGFIQSDIAVETAGMPAESSLMCCWMAGPGLSQPSDLLSWEEGGSRGAEALRFWTEEVGVGDGAAPLWKLTGEAASGLQRRREERGSVKFFWDYDGYGEDDDDDEEEDENQNEDDDENDVHTKSGFGSGQWRRKETKMKEDG